MDSLAWRTSVVVGLLCLVSLAGALQCMQCYSSIETGGDCYNDTTGMYSMLRGDSQIYNKTCDPDKNQTMCMIEKMENKAGFVMFHRDCSDGELFSFTGQLQANSYERLKNLKPDNETTCMYYFQYQAFICVTLCEGDFCNGPTLPPNDTTNGTDCGNGTENATCAGTRPLFFFNPGPLGMAVDSFLGNAFVIPMLVYAITIILL